MYRSLLRMPRSTFSATSSGSHAEALQLGDTRQDARILLAHLPGERRRPDFVAVMDLRVDEPGHSIETPMPSGASDQRSDSLRPRTANFEAV
jgi:hypothetical protein